MAKLAQSPWIAGGSTGPKSLATGRTLMLASFEDQLTWQSVDNVAESYSTRTIHDYIMYLSNVPTRKQCRITHLGLPK